MSNKPKRLEGVSTGGGGANITKKVSKMLEDMNLPSLIGYTLIDTNKRSLQKITALLPEGIRTRIHSKIIGPGNGSGCDPEAARCYIEDEKTHADLLAMFENDTFEAAPVFGTLGKGTATGTILEILKILRMARVMAFGIVVRCSQEHGEVEEAQDNAAAETIEKLDESGIPYALAMNRAAYNESEKRPGEKMTKEMAYALIDEEIANALRAFLRVLADPSQADREDIRKLIYAGGTEGRKRWRFSTARLGKNFTEKDLIEAVHKCFENEYFDFDNSRIGGTLIIREGEFAAHEVSGMNLEIRSLVQGWKEESKDDKREITNRHYRLVEADYPSLDDSYTITFLFSEYNGDPDLDNLPEIRWLDEEPVQFVAETIKPTLQTPGVNNGTGSHEIKDWRKPVPVSSNRDRTEFYNLRDFLAAYNVGNTAARDLAANNDTPPFPIEWEGILTGAALLKEAKKQGLKLSWYGSMFKILSAKVKLSPLPGLIGLGRSTIGFDDKNPVPTLDKVKAFLSQKNLSEKEKRTGIIFKLAIELLPVEERSTALNSFELEEVAVSVKKPENGFGKALDGILSNISRIPWHGPTKTPQ